MYSNLMSCIDTPNGLTDFFSCYTGTRQGCLLSPLLFILFLDRFLDFCNQNGCRGVYIDEQYENVCVLLYADDMSQLADLTGRLQYQINTLQAFCTNSGMQVNIDKTKIIVFRNGGPLRRSERWFFEEKPFETGLYDGDNEPEKPAYPK